MNNVCQSGRVTRDPQLRKTNSGTAVVAFNLAVNRDRIGKDGKKMVDFIPCVIWRKGAENFVKYVKKGTLVEITGFNSTRTYQKGDTKVFVMEVTALTFRVLESRSAIEHRQQAADHTAPASEEFPEDGSYDPYDSGHTWVDISDDDMPF